MINHIKKIFDSGGQILSRPHSNIFSAALIVATTYGASMLLGVWRERLIVSRFYSCCVPDLDAYYAAFRLPDMVFQLVVIGALSAAFIPIYTRQLNKSDNQSDVLASSVLNSLLLVFVTLAVVIFIFAQPISSAITGNFTLAQISQMASMTRLMLVAQALFLISNLLAAIIQSHRRFLLPALSPVVYNLGIILSVWLLSGTIGIWSAAVGVVLGALLHLLIQIPLSRRLGFHYRFIIDYKDKAFQQVGRLMLPRTISLAAGQIESTISLFLATSLSVGSLTLYYLAHKLADLPVRIIGTSIGQAALPQLVKQQDDQQSVGFRLTLINTLSMLFYLAFPATGFFLVLRLQLVRLAYGSNTFPWEATIATGQVMAAIVLSIFSQSAIQLIVRAYYAVADTKTPLYAGLLSVAINLGLSLLFIKFYHLGVFGLALAFTIANSINFSYLIIQFHYRHEKIVDIKVLRLWSKMFLVSAVATICTWALMRVLDLVIFDTSHVVGLVGLTMLCFIFGLLVYYLITLLLKMEQANMVMTIIRRFGHFKDILTSSSMVQETPKID